MNAFAKILPSALFFFAAAGLHAQVDATVVAKLPAPIAEPAPPQPKVTAVAYLELARGPKSLAAMVEAPEPGFFAVVLLSASPTLAHSLVGLPPLLADSVVLAAGRADGQVFRAAVPLSPRAPDFALFGQAVVFDSSGIGASGLVPIGGYGRQ